MLALGEWADTLGAAIAGRSGRTALSAFAERSGRPRGPTARPRRHGSWPPP